MVYRFSRVVAASAGALIPIALGSCATVTPTADARATAVPTITVSAAPSLSGAGSTIAPTTPSPAQDLATYPPTPAGGSGIQVASPCGSAILRMSAGPDGEGVGMTATLKKMADSTRWVDGGLSISPFAIEQGEPAFPRQKVSGGVLRMRGTNRTGIDALHDPTLNYAWPQSVAVDVKGGLCYSVAYLNSTRGTLDTESLHVQIQRDTGTIKIHKVQMETRGPWQITITTTSHGGTQQQAKTVTAKKGNYIGALYFFDTTFTRVTNLHDFTTLTIRASKIDGSYADWVTMTRTP